MKCPSLSAKLEFSLLWLLLSLILSALVTSSCTSTNTQAGDPPSRHFYETATASVIVNFPSWDSISITRPPMAEGGFMNFYDRSQIGEVLRNIPVDRELAVIVCGFAYSPEQEQQQQQMWSSLLAKAGFKRVVFVRAASPNHINGAEIVRELQLSGKSA